MSRAFVKENDLEHAGTDLPERPQSEHPNYVTPAGLAGLRAQLDQLEQERLGLVPRKDDPIVRQRMAMIDRAGLDWGQVVFHCFTEGPAEMAELTQRMPKDVTLLEIELKSKRLALLESAARVASIRSRRASLPSA